MELINDILGVMRQLRENNFKIMGFEISQEFLTEKLIPIFNQTEWYNKPITDDSRGNASLFGYPLKVATYAPPHDIQIEVLDSRIQCYANWNNDNIVVTGEIQTRIIKRN